MPIVEASRVEVGPAAAGRPRRMRLGTVAVVLISGCCELAGGLVARVEDTLQAPGVTRGAAQADPRTGSAPAGTQVPSPAAAKSSPAPADAAKATARARIRSSSGTVGKRSYTNPIEVRLEFRGGAAARAVSFGRLKFTTAVGDGGRRLELIEAGGGTNFGSEFSDIDRTEKDFFSNQPIHPADGFATKALFHRPDGMAPKIAHLAGTVTVQTARAVIIENIGALLADSGQVALKNPALDAVGTFGLEREGEQVTVSAQGPKGKLEALTVHIRDDAGNPMDFNGSVGNTANERMDKRFNFAVGAVSLPKARLEILLPEGTSEVPFEFRDLAVAAGR